MTPDDMRRIALTMPEAVESAHMAHPDFRVRGRIFATLWPAEGRGVVKLPAEQQGLLAEAEPSVFEPVPGAWGVQGWTNVRLAAADEATLRSAVTAAWRTVAPRRLVTQFDRRK
jgi:hypothetical protein